MSENFQLKRLNFPTKVVERSVRAKIWIQIDLMPKLLFFSTVPFTVQTEGQAMLWIQPILIYLFDDWLIDDWLIGDSLADQTCSMPRLQQDKRNQFSYYPPFCTFE